YDRPPESRGPHGDGARTRLALAGAAADRRPRRGGRAPDRGALDDPEAGLKGSPMDFDLTDEQRLIKQTAREFTDKEIVLQSRENARNHHFDLDLVKKVAEQGYLGAVIPQEYGGAGLDYLSYGLIVEEIGRGDSAIRTV